MHIEYLTTESSPAIWKRKTLYGRIGIPLKMEKFLAR
jgi:hypothetical protein